MDPDANLREYLEAIRDRDTDRMMVLAASLADWIEGGGFLPDMIRNRFELENRPPIKIDDPDAWLDDYGWREKNSGTTK